MSQTQWIPPAPPTGPWDAAAPEPSREPEPAARQKKERGILGTLIVVGALLLKFGKFIPAVLKAGPALSMLVSVGAYALIWGWKFGVGIVALLFVHELGHWIQFRREGIKPDKMIFVPLLGAAVLAKEKLPDAIAEARVALAGPILGSIGALACLPLYLATDDVFFKGLAFTGLFLNLINLIPVLPLDGGRVASALSKWVWMAGLLVVLTAVFVIPNPVIILLAFVCALFTYRRFKTSDDRELQSLRRSHRIAVGVVYIGLIVALSVGMDLTFVERDFNDA